MTPKAEAIIFAVFWALSILLVLYLALKFQAMAAQGTQDKIKLKDDETEKSVNGSTLSDLVKLNNDQDGKGGKS